MRSVKWSGVSGVDSPGSVPGPPQSQCSQQCVLCADATTGCSFNGPVVHNRF